MEPSTLTDEEMYHAFRHVVDSYAFPIMKRWGESSGTYRHIMYHGRPVGFLLVIDNYIDAIYVRPDYRRKGLAKKAVLDYIREGNHVYRLHIVKTNEPAMKFWNSVFFLREIERNECDVLFFIEGIKAKEYHNGQTQT